MEEILIRGWEITLPKGQQDLDVGPRGISSRALTPRAPVNQQSDSGVGVSTSCGAVSTTQLVRVSSSLFRQQIISLVRDTIAWPPPS